VVFFVVAIGVLVTAHEFGHFWVARRLGVKVLRFSIGFGHAWLVWHRRGDETEYALGAIPLGGYVKMLDESEGEVAPEERARAFNRQSLGIRSAVVVAGPLFNFVFAVLAFWLMFMIGVSGLRATVGGVTPDSPAARAGILEGDQVVAAAGRRTPTWDDVVQVLVAKVMDGGVVTLVLRDASGGRREVALKLGGLTLDDMTEGRVFSAIGVRPGPPLAPIIDSVVPGSPAQASGMRAGDRVLAADGRSIADWPAWVAYVRARPGITIATRVERDGKRLVLSLTPERVVDESGAHGRIGASVRRPSAESLKALAVTVRYGPLDAFGHALRQTADATTLTLRFLWKMVRGQASIKNLSGPISIAQYAGISAQGGLARFLWFLAIVSVSLGILNLLPIPLLDGGHLLYYAAELVRGRPLSEHTRLIGQRLGIAFLVGLMGLAFYNDLARLFG